MSEIPFIDYLNTVDDLLETRYGITSRDTDTASIATARASAKPVKKASRPNT